MRYLILGMVILTMSSACDNKRTKCERLSKKANQALSGVLGIYEQQHKEKGAFVDACVNDPAMTDEVINCFLEADGLLAATACTLLMNKDSK